MKTIYKIYKSNNKLTYFGVFLFLLLAGFFYGKNVPQARADNEDIAKYGAIFDNTNGAGTPNYARIIKKDNTYHMWYEDSTTDFFYHTTSIDGQHWAALGGRGINRCHWRS